MLDSVFTQNAVTVGKVMLGACMHILQRELGVELDSVQIQGEGLLLDQKLEVPLHVMTVFCVDVYRAKHSSHCYWCT